MAWTLAHEISQPLTSATNYIRACALQLRRRGEGLEELAGLVEDAGKETVRAGEIIGRMRDFLINGRVRARRENLRGMIEDARRSLGSAERAGVEIITTMGSNTSYVMVDRIQIGQVLSIILANACEAVAGRSLRRISIDASRSGDEVVLLIRDSGPGLSDYVRTLLFEPLFTTKAGGTGLGLSICRTIIEAHGGRIWAESPPGGGAVFGVSLPAAK